MHLDFPARDDMPPVKLTWYDGGLKPEKPAELEDDRRLPSEGTIFIGTKGILLCDFNGGQMELFPRARKEMFVEPPRTLPRSRVTRKDGPKTDCAAVAPRQTSSFGLTSRSSASSQGRHAAISRELGFLWMRRFPRGSHLKCFTVFVT